MLVQDTLRQFAGARELALLPGASFLVAADDGAVPAPAERLDAELGTSLADLAELDAEDAAALLRGVRSEVRELVVWP